ncbi:hypothetical protein FBZ92_13024 [Nitrospirillum viridazoti]|uniref:Uncharacterized protein n=2 Tax=Nitrospirillum TaxID=1543705 RepID=A0A560HTA3_9PROT|nr:hypothetical protein FBZ92_13024 [Nitrospirillum amazonense]
MLWVTVAVGMVPIVGMMVYAHASGLVAGVAMVVWFFVAILLPRFWWPLGIPETGAPPATEAHDISSTGLRD